MLRKFLIGFVAVFSAWFLLFWFSKKNDQLTARQRLLRLVYPVLTAIGRMSGAHAVVLQRPADAASPVSVYDIPFTTNEGKVMTLSAFRGKKIMLVNTASDCGYTPQYDQLQALHAQYGDRLVIIGFPANDFKEQEKGSNEEIGAFCKRNYGVTFLLAEKSIVSKKEGQHSLFQWLTSKDANGWNTKAPIWNFSKYLIDEEGRLTHFFGPAIEPNSTLVTSQL